MRTTISTASRHCSRDRSSVGTPNAACSIGVGAAGPPLHSALGQDVDGGHLLRNAGGVDEPEGHERHPETQLDLVGREGQAPQNGLRARRRRATVAEVVLHHPDGVESQPVGQLDLLDPFGVGALLGVALAIRMGQRPRLDLRLELVQQVESHD